ncbi:MAG: lactate utilization protein [Ruminococcaceae bacterium]|nr:lactate utilization protein [Oscillospiraceae bacterium]
MNVSLEKTVENLRKNHMLVHYVATRQEVPALVRSLMPSASSVAVGGSVTLDETGVLDLLRDGTYRFLDRYAPGLTRDEVEGIFRASFDADWYITSTNAITEQGELYNVDGNANRIAALAYGPRQVIVVAGVNKLVPDLAAAVHRVKTVAAPLNAKRLNKSTPCALCGQCVHPEGSLTEGCDSPDRICASALITSRQIRSDRIHVILVGEPCGY